MEKNIITATGRRKTSVAQVKLVQNGEGKVTINTKTPEAYFGNNPRLKYVITSPFDLAKDQKFDCIAKVVGGGLSSQAGAIRHGVARAIASLGESFHSSMKKAGFLTRDPRMVERKKPGQPKARKRFQFSKR
ncbi:MAG: 30S ribosomal protein S9 [Elusimicrobia bacterium RIFOXYA12_FULL_51_18]|nr:MAG: 30S ribosomal protein S9 [Elusimicrobia bacterium RIFOXYA12_FULL_51_18]OGS31257.1 MAG: 30S ribosomal protein S9 [Elusimicrobia bacterium RIFOXYA2_FULL_53_38]